MKLKTGAIVLAAGAASRFGRPKQLLELEGETLVARACRLAAEAGCAPVVRVLGAHAAAIQARPGPDAAIDAIHPQWADGMGGSLAHGMATLLAHAPELEAVVILLCDQPALDAGLLRQLIGSLATASIALSDYGSATGPPAAFTRAHFPALLALTGDYGAKAVVKAHPAAVRAIPFPGGAWDIDSEAAWRKFTTSSREPV